MTRLELARKGVVTDEIKAVAEAEGVDAKILTRNLRRGRAVVVRNSSRDIRPLGIGAGLSVKVNANIGSSDTAGDIETEILKLRSAIEAGADAVMDLSTGAKIRQTRERLLALSPLAFGTVPLYEAMAGSCGKDGPEPERIGGRDMVETIRAHVEAGVDFITVHAGLRARHIPLLKSRVMGVVSRGGSFLLSWMRAHGEENPLFERFDEIVAIAKRRDVALSLGDALRPGATADSGDRAQLAELDTLAALARRARKAGVQVIIEGPGHVPLHRVAESVRVEKRKCAGAPFYVLGPLATDCAVGYDHIAGAIGGAVAAMAGADFLCYLTPREHLGLPEAEHVAEGVYASRIAAHAADLARGRPAALGRDLAMSKARARLDWEAMFGAALAPERARKLRHEAASGEGCSMCGALCSAKASRDALRPTGGAV